MDHNELTETMAKIQKAIYDLEEMDVAVGHARQIIAMASTTRSRILANYTRKYLRTEKSAPKAEALARSDADYLAEIEDHAKTLAIAEQANHRARRTFASLDALRSLLSYGKETFVKEIR